MSAPQDLTSEAELHVVLQAAGGQLVVLHFFATWAAQCTHMNEVLAELSKLHPTAHFYKMEAENVPEVSVQFEITAVPTVLFFKHGGVVDRVDGAKAAEVAAKVEKLKVEDGKPAPASAGGSTGGGAAPAAAVSKEALHARLQALVNAAPVMLFIKGSPSEARCGFSKQIVALLQEQGVEFSSFDILQDDEVRQGLKEFSQWPTYPQLYAGGKLVGGLDIVKELIAAGEFKDALPKKASKEELNARLAALVSQQPIMLFMKGTPEAPRCGFSAKIVAVLREAGADFGHYDILGDEEVRQGLKEFSQWPTYPQLYAGGKLVGGLDIVNELKEAGELRQALGLSA